MSAADLRRVADLADTLRKAADSLAASESAAQALRERGDKLFALDAEIKSRSESLAGLTEKMSSLRSSFEGMEGKVEEVRTARLAEVDSYASSYRTVMNARLTAEENALEEGLSVLRAIRASLTDEVAALTSTRDTLQSEIDSAKQRVSNL